MSKFVTISIILIVVYVASIFPANDAKDIRSAGPASIARGRGGAVRGKAPPLRGRGGNEQSSSVPVPAPVAEKVAMPADAAKKPASTAQSPPDGAVDPKIVQKMASLVLKTDSAPPAPKPSATVAAAAPPGATAAKQGEVTVEGIFQDLFKDVASDRARAAADLVAQVRLHGAYWLESSGALPRLTQALQQAGKVGNERLGALEAISALVEDIGAPVEPYVLPLLGLMAECHGHKSAAVAAAARGACERLVAAANAQAVRLMLPALLAAARHDRWAVNEAAMRLLRTLAAAAETAPQLAFELYEAVPVIAELMWHSRDEVVAAATDAMSAAAATARNRDLEPFIPVMIGCILEPTKVPECVHKLAATVFVQEIRSAALAVVVPLLARGLVERETVIRRKSCTIIDNMCKMIEQPEEAIAFMPRVLPLVRKATEDIPDPEARQVAARCLTTLQTIESTAVESKKMDPDAVLAALTEIMSADTPPPPAPALTDNISADTPAPALTDNISADKPAAAAADAPSGDNPRHPHHPPPAHAPAAAAIARAAEHASRLCSIMVSNRNFEEAAWQDAVHPYLGPLVGSERARRVAGELLERCFRETRPRESQEYEDEAGEDLCNIEFSLGYGAMMLLTNTRLHMKRGKRYGLCGPNGCGKSTLMRAIVNGQVEGFPPADQVRTVYVEHDIQGTESNCSVEEFVFRDPRLNGESVEEVRRVMTSVGFTTDMLQQAVTTLSGGWKMKVALARAMLMRADILLLDEPTNHLDVSNVRWLENYLCTLSNVTSMIVSHDSGFLDRVCTHITHFEKNRKLRNYLGNLSHFVKCKPEAKVYYELTNEFLKFTLPEPGYLEGVKSKGKPILKMSGVQFTYPGNTKPTVWGISLSCCLSSRVAVIGPNGAGKSTIIKLLTGEYKPDCGDVWKHPNMRIAYVAQHAFHHLEQHLDKTPNEYIQWRYAGGEDRESLTKETKKISEEERAKMEAVQLVQNEDGVMEKRVVEELLARRKCKNGYEYEVKWVGLPMEKNMWIERDKLVEMGFVKMVSRMDEREALRLGTSGKALTGREVEKALSNMGLEPEFATHNRIRGLSGGQRVKVVLAAAMWEDPHLLVLDEPTNYLDRDSLGALAAAIRDYAGGVIMISHNREFTGALCPETWICEAGRLRREGESFAEDVKIVNPADALMAEQKEVKDSYGNVVKVEKKLALKGKDLKKYQKMKEARRKRGEHVSDTEEDE